MKPVLETATKYGKVRGRLAGNQNIAVYKGIPYGAPPVGALRYMPPRDPEPWEAVLDCNEFKTPAWQEDTPLGTLFGDFFIKEFYPVVTEKTEDCLYLNIWTPAKSTDEKLPVMMWIHGGGLGSGYGHEMEFDGEALAKKGVILITLNYRLNHFGFFAHPELSKRNPNGVSGNNCHLDHLQALKWIHENIAAFGGDPENVLVFGQSGGAGATNALLSSEIAQPYFHKAIIQSGPHGLNTRKAFTLKDAEDWGVKFCEYLGKTLDELLEMPGEDVYNAFQAAVKVIGPAPQTIVDGCFLKTSSWEAAFEGRYTKDILCGFVSGDGTLVFPEPPSSDPWQKKVAVRKIGSENAEKLLEAYPYEIGENEEIYKALDSAVCTPLQAAALGEDQLKYGRKPVYAYLFDPYMPGGDEFNFVGDGTAYHSCELWYVFGTLGRCWRPFDGRHYDLAEKIQSYWTNFAKTGDPNGENLPKWEAYDHHCGGIMYFNENTAETRSCYTDGAIGKVLDVIYEK